MNQGGKDRAAASISFIRRRASTTATSYSVQTSTTTPTGGGSTSPVSMMMYQTRWSAKRLRDYANSLNDDKRAILSKSCFGDMMYMSPFAAPPEELIDFVAMRIDTEKRKFKVNNKTIIFQKDMVQKIFNVPSGDRPVKLLKRGEKSEFQELYIDGNRYPVAYTPNILSKAADDDADTIERSWVLLCLALVLAPGTGNMVPIEYAASLGEMGKALEQYAWDEHILDDLMKEIKIYQEKRIQYHGTGKFFTIGSCLPILAILYMDHINIPRACIVDHSINYLLPRMCFVSDLDFSAVIAFDTNNLDLHNAFGKRNFVPLSYTPYAVSSFKPYIEQLLELKPKYGVVEDIPQSNVATEKPCPDVPETSSKQPTPPPLPTEHVDDVFSSLEEWLHQLPSMKDLELPPHLQELYEKHIDLYCTELKATFNSFQSTLQTLFCGRMRLLLFDAHEAGPSREEKKDKGDGVTFSIPAASAATGTTGNNEPKLEANLQPPKPVSRSAECSDIVAEAGRNNLGYRNTEAGRNRTGDRNTEQTEAGHEIMGDCSIGDRNTLQAEAGRNSIGDPNTEQAEAERASTGDCNTEQAEAGRNSIGDRNTEQNKCANNVSAAQHSDHSNIQNKGVLGKSTAWEDLSHVNLTRRKNTLEEGGSFGLFEEGSEDDLIFKGESPIRDPSSPGSPSNFLVVRHVSGKPLFDETPKDHQVPQGMPTPVYDVTPISTKLPLSTGPPEAGVAGTKDVVAEVSSGRSTDEKKTNKKKRKAKAEENVPKMKKIKLDAV